MKWFTTEWAGGELSEDEDEARRTDYLSHVQAMLPRLPEALRPFTGEPDEMGHVTLHDGRVEWWPLDEARSFTVQVICGYLQIGYRRLIIQYRGQVEIFGASESDVAGWLNDAETEFRYDEVDVASDGRFEHRFLLWPRGEFGVRFEDVVLVSAPTSYNAYDLVWRRKRFESSATFKRVKKAWETARWRSESVRWWARRLWHHLRDLRHAFRRRS